MSWHIQQMSRHSDGISFFILLFFSLASFCDQFFSGGDYLLAFPVAI